MAQHVNFYENIKEANLRLRDTVVLYDGKPYYVLCITNHKDDGIFRVYLDDLSREDGMAHQRHSIPYEWHDEPGMSKGDKMDAWLEKYEGQGLIRKMMNSPKFNKYRPFPLGMCNYGGSPVYIERTPMRHTQQGLTHSMLMGVIPGDGSRARRSMLPSFTGYEFYKTIVGDYPRPDESLHNLNNPEFLNTGMAFDRNFAFLRGPVGIMLLAYKSEVIGYMPNADFSRINLGPNYKHTKEVVQDLQLFEDIRS